jgi:glycosyltransferase involved in cell wall biosynthesis
MKDCLGLSNRQRANAVQSGRDAEHSASKRICMIAYAHYRYDPRIRRAAEAFASRGDTVDFISLSEGSTSEEETINRVRITPLRLVKYRGRNVGEYVFGYLRFLAVASWTLTRRHLHNRYDVIYIHTMPDFMVFASLPAKLLGAKVVLDVHDTMPELWQSKFGVPEQSISVRLAKLLEWVSCWFADQVVVVHEPHRRLLQSRGVAGSKIAVVMNAPDPTVFGSVLSHRNDYTEASGQPRLVYHGTITERLGLDIAILAFKEVLDVVPSARFELYGTGNFASEVAGLIESLGLEKSVYFPNRFFSLKDIPKLLRGATIGIIPNRSDAATRYMLPSKLLEYVHLGIPAVVPKLEVIQHYFKDDSVGYFIPGNVTSLRSVICALLADPDRRMRMALNSQRFCQEYAWGGMKSHLLETVDRLASE